MNRVWSEPEFIKSYTATPFDFEVHQTQEPFRKQGALFAFANPEQRLRQIICEISKAIAFIVVCLALVFLGACL